MTPMYNLLHAHSSSPILLSTPPAVLTVRRSFFLSHPKSPVTPRFKINLAQFMIEWVAICEIGPLTLLEAAKAEVGDHEDAQKG